MIEETGTPPEILAQLRRRIIKHFSDDELRTLCFDMGVSYDSLGGQGTDGKARELVGYCDRHGHILRLIITCRELNPNVLWPEPEYLLQPLAETSQQTLGSASPERIKELDRLRQLYKDLNRTKELHNDLVERINNALGSLIIDYTGQPQAKSSLTLPSRMIGSPSEILDAGADKYNPIVKLNVASDIHLHQKEFLQAFHCANEAARLANLRGDRQQAGCAYTRLAEVERAQGHIENALEHYHMAEDSFAVLKGNRNRVIIWTYIIEIHLENQKWIQVIHYCQLALDMLAQLKTESRATGRNEETTQYTEWQQRIQKVRNDALRQYEPATVNQLGWGEFTQLPVLIEPIPAGAPRDLTRLPHDRIAADEFIVHGRMYKIKPLHVDRRVLFTGEDRYIAVPVLGDSMVEAEIVEGDFVVLKLWDARESSLVNGDIVAAEITEDYEVTLKQYSVNADGVQYLQACSTNPKWRDYRIEISDSNVQIRGIAIAVLKPQNDE